MADKQVRNYNSRSGGTGYSRRGSSQPHRSTSGYSQRGSSQPHRSASGYSQRGSSQPHRSSSGYSQRGSSQPHRSSSGYSQRGSSRQRGSGSGYSSKGKSSSGTRKSGSSGTSLFFRTMTMLAIAGIAAALYLNGYFSRWMSSLSEYASDGILEKLDIDIIDSLTSTSSTAAPTAEAPTSTAETTTRLTAASTAKPQTTKTTATSVTTTAAKQPEGAGNADYVDQPDYESPYYIVVFTGSQSVVVYGKDSEGFYNVKTKCFTCSTGAPGTPTRTGLYSIKRSYRWHPLMGGVYGQYCSGFSDSYLFHSVLYEDEDNTTLYSNSYRNLGEAASHGCVRLCVRDAKWIYDNCPHGTQVHVVNAKGPAGESDLPEIRSGSKYRGWEPTDPDEDNPYNK